MKPLGLTLSAFIFLTLPLAAQNPTPAAPQPSPERLDQLLKAWEDRMSATESLLTKTTRTSVHGITKKSTTFVGEAAFQKPSMARIDLTAQDEVGKKDAEKTNFERIFCNGQYIYEYAPKEKLIVIHDMPKGAADDNLILSFLRGMKADVAKKRFEITLTKEDPWYGYLMIMPKTDADKAEFSAAQLTVWMKNPNPQGKPNVAMMPVRLWYKQPNGNEVTYTFGDMEPNAKLDKEAFVPRQIPGWKVERAAAAAPQAPMSPIVPKGSTVRNQQP